MTWPARRLIAAFGTTALICGCSKTPSEKEIVDSMVSWIGTADMASQAWLKHTTFDRYTLETLELSAEKLGDQQKQLQETGALKSSGYGSPGLDSAATRAAHSMITIAGLVGENDAPDVRIQLDSLRAAKKIVLAASDSLAKQQQ